MSDIPPLTERDRDQLIRTCWGEAGGAHAQPIAGIVAVMHVVRNRAILKGTDAYTECQRPKQFSGWNFVGGRPQFPAVFNMMQNLALHSPAYLTLGDIADNCWESPLDFSDGALHYANLAVVKPAWARQAKRSFAIGDHTFFVGVPW